MKDNDLIMAGMVVMFLAFLLVTMGNTISSGMRYRTFLQSQTLVLSCRAERASASSSKTIEEICGPVPKYEDFK